MSGISEAELFRGYGLDKEPTPAPGAPKGAEPRARQGNDFGVPEVGAEVPTGPLAGATPLASAGERS